MRHSISVPRKIQEQILDEMRWIDFTRNDTLVTLVSYSPGCRSLTLAAAALLPWNRNRRPKKIQNRG